jgi:hypothetical protein
MPLDAPVTTTTESLTRMQAAVPSRTNLKPAGASTEARAIRPVERSAGTALPAMASTTPLRTGLENSVTSRTESMREDRTTPPTKADPLSTTWTLRRARA